VGTQPPCSYMFHLADHHKPERWGATGFRLVMPPPSPDLC
jgi:hypothetical protein